MGRIHDVGVGDDVAATVDEPAGARLDVRGRADGDRTAPAVQGHVAAYRGGDQHHRRLDAEDRFLDGIGCGEGGSADPGTREEEHEHQGSMAPEPLHEDLDAYYDART